MKERDDMKKQFKFMAFAVLSSATILGACSNGESETKKEEVKQVQTSEKTEEASLTKGQEMANTLSATNWKGTRVYDAEKNDLTKENQNFIGLAKYDAQTGKYEFFDAKTGKTRGDEGTFFVTNDGQKRILISDTMKYQAVVDLTELNDEIFTYKRMGKDQNGKDVEVFVEHVPYKEKELAFTNAPKTFEETEAVETKTDGDKILSETLWYGTKVLDEKGNDVTKANQNFLSIAKFDEQTNQYEFFDQKTGKTRSDFGYFDVINKNHVRAHVSLGENKYGVALELTELNNQKFTYKRMGKDEAGKDITIYVEHEPYKGELQPTFSF